MAIKYLSKQAQKSSPTTRYEHGVSTVTDFSLSLTTFLPPIYCNMANRHNLPNSALVYGCLWSKIVQGPSLGRVQLPPLPLTKRSRKLLILRWFATKKSRFSDFKIRSDFTNFGGGGRANSPHTDIPIICMSKRIGTLGFANGCGELLFETKRSMRLYCGEVFCIYTFKISFSFSTCCGQIELY